ncbi:MAG: haloalkane dehalogenase [Myxococcota bacterium]|nr:haloalkane dehalogenase [Myxococcota bacterium]
MPDVFRTPESRFASLKEYPFTPRYLEWEGLRMHHVDEGPRDAPVALLLHGMPTWSYLYRRMIPGLTAAGFRCVAPDYVGFGKSDKVTDDGWYSIERHSQSIAHFVRELDLCDITLVCQDWGGPIGLRQVVDMPERFVRLCIMNTWLHNPTHEYTDAIRNWNRQWHPGGLYDERQACGEVMRFQVEHVEGSTLSPEEAFAAYEAPFPDRASKAGPRRFPLSLPFDNPEGGNAVDQARCFEALRTWTRPVHFIWGTLDPIFTESWAETWSGIYPQATLDKLPASHFLQETHGEAIVERLLARIAEE